MAKQTTDQAPEAPLPYPAEGCDALLATGTESFDAEGFTFAPDSLTIVPEDVALRLAGHGGLRLVMETPQSWPHFLAMRARRPG